MKNRYDLIEINEYEYSIRLNKRKPRTYDCALKEDMYELVNNLNQSMEQLTEYKIRYRTVREKNTDLELELQSLTEHYRELIHDHHHEIRDSTAYNAGYRQAIEDMKLKIGGLI